VYLALERCSKSLADALGKAKSRRDRLLRRASSSSSSASPAGAISSSSAAAATPPSYASAVAASPGRHPRRPTSASMRRLLVPPPSHATRRFLRELVVGVAYIHLNKIVHRDIKPQNVLLVPLRTKKAARVVRQAEADAAAAEGREVDDALLRDETALLGTPAQFGGARGGAGAGAGGQGAAAGGSLEERLLKGEFHELGSKWRPKVRHHRWCAGGSFGSGSVVVVVVVVVAFAFGFVCVCVCYAVLACLCRFAHLLLPPRDATGVRHGSGQAAPRLCQLL